MSYQMRNSSRSRNAGRFVSRVQKELQGALGQSGLRQQQIAEKLDADKSTIHRRFSGRANLTLRSIADLAWAMEHEIQFSLKPKHLNKGNEDESSINTTETPSTNIQTLQYHSGSEKNALLGARPAASRNNIKVIVHENS